MELCRQYRAFSTTPPAPRKQLSEGSTSASATTKDPNKQWIEFDPDDPASPHNWSRPYKTWVVMLLSWLSLSLTFASSISSPTVHQLMDEFHCSWEVGQLTTTMFLIGTGIGSMPSAPLSELFGRLPVYIISLLLATVFAVGCAVSNSITCLCIMRLLGGFMSAAPLANAGGSLNDVSNAVVRSLTLPVYAATGFVGPVLGPLVGSYVANSPHLGWRWCYWIVVIANGAAFLTTTLFMPETNAAALLRFKAFKLRRAGHKEWFAPIEEASLGQATADSLKRPFKMLAVEPILQLVVLYLTIVYICLYGFFVAYPIVFSTHGIGPAKVGLMYIPILVGFALLFIIKYLHFLRYRRLATTPAKGIPSSPVVPDTNSTSSDSATIVDGGEANDVDWDGKLIHVEPEERLIPLMFTCILLPAGLFWFAWTSPSRYSVWALMMSGIPFGIGVLGVFQDSYLYLIDAYGQYASSALAGATLVRYVVSGCVILAFPRMFQTLGHPWAGSLLGFLAVAMIPVPYAFYYFGSRIRARCEFTTRPPS